MPALSIVAVLITAAAALQFVREQRYPPPPVTEQVLYVTSGNAARRLTVGYQTLAADLYWIRAVQHYGGTKRANDQLRDKGAKTLGFPLLYPLLDLTTSLDPYFNIAYRFGAIFLAEPDPYGPGRPDLAVKLLEKGLAARPDKWEYMWDLGFVYYRTRDYQASSDWFLRGSQVPGAPWWLQSMAAVTLAEGGDRRSSRLMWDAILQGAEIDWLRSEAERRLRQLDALDAIDTLQAHVDRVTKAWGRAPKDWGELIAARLLTAVPADPAGTPYRLENGRVTLAIESDLYPLPDEPQAVPPA